MRRTYRPFQKLLSLVALFAAVATTTDVRAQDDTNYDEADVPAYTLPDPLVMEDGTPVEGADVWQTRRRPELLRLFEEHVYGEVPEAPEGMRFEVTSVDTAALGGLATRRQVTIHFAADVRADSSGPKLDVLLYVPNNAPRPVPAFLGLNFYGNHSIHPDSAIALPTSWMREGAEYGVEDHRATEAGRGVRARRWPVERILARGYALATAYYGDLDPDYDDGFENGVHPLFREMGVADSLQSAISAWAWGLSRAMDYLETDPDVDADRVAVMGHSRLGKAALWAGAQDERFALVVSNNSGEGGAALARRRYGERVSHLNNRFPHWFADAYARYDENERAMPVDQHQLIALVAPRPVYVASAQEDRWADPRGEFLAAQGADPVYRLLGAEPLPADTMPAPNRPVLDGAIGYHVRTGGHDLTTYDWDQYLAFADRHLRSSVD